MPPDHSKDSQAFHNRILRAWGDPYKLPDAYAWRWIAHHLVKAGRREELRRLLLDFAWLRAKLAATMDGRALISDFRFFDNDPTALLVQSAIRLSMPTLAAGPSQLGPQLFGRLLTVADPEIRGLLEQVSRAGDAWLRLLRPALTAPGGPLFASMEGHKGSVTAVAVTADGRWVISGSQDKTIRIWDRKSASLVRTLQGHDGFVRAIAVTADGGRVVSGANDKTVRTWDRLSGKLALTLEGHTSSVNAVAVTRDGRWVVSGSGDRTVRIWDRENGEPVHTLIGHTAEVNAIAVSSDARWVFSGSSDFTVRVWDRVAGVEAGKLTIDRGGMSWVYNLALCDQASTVIVSTYNGVWVWQWQRGKVRRLRSEENGGGPLVVTPDGLRVIACSGVKIEALDVQTGEVSGTWEHHSGSVTAVAGSADGRWLVSGSVDQSVNVWDLECQGGTPAIETGRLLASADGRWAAIQAAARTRIWDVERAAPVREVAGGHWGCALVATPRTGWWVVASQGHVVTLRDLSNGTVRKLGGETRADVAAASWDGRRLVVGSDDWGDDPMVVWDLESGRRLLEPDVGAALAVAMSGDGRWVAGCFGGVEPRIGVWDLETGTETHSWEGTAGALAISYDGRWMVGGQGSLVRVWDTQSGNEAVTLSGHTGSITSVAVTADGSRVVSGSSDKTVRVWNRETGAVIASFHAEAAVKSCAITPDGGTIIVSDRLLRAYFLRFEETDGSGPEPR